MRMCHLNIALVSLLFIVSCSKEVSFESTVEREGLRFEVNSNKPFTGKTIEYYKDDILNPNTEKKIYSSKNFKNGLLDGISESYHMNGQISSRESYKKGLKEGIHESFQENGVLIKRESFKNDLLDGPYEIYLFYEGKKMSEDKGSYIKGSRRGLRTLKGYGDDDEIVSQVFYLENKPYKSVANTYQNNILKLVSYDSEDKAIMTIGYEEDEIQYYNFQVNNVEHDFSLVIECIAEGKSTRECDKRIQYYFYTERNKEVCWQGDALNKINLDSCKDMVFNESKNEIAIRFLTELENARNLSEDGNLDNFEFTVE